MKLLLVCMCMLGCASTIPQEVSLPLPKPVSIQRGPEEINKAIEEQPQHIPSFLELYSKLNTVWVQSFTIANLEKEDNENIEEVMKKYHDKVWETSNYSDDEEEQRKTEGKLIRLNKRLDDYIRLLNEQRNEVELFHHQLMELQRSK